MKNSYTQHIKTQMQTTKQRVMSLLRWNEEQYAAYQFKTGKQYLQSYIAKDPAGIDMLVANRIFWNWWKNQWLLRDMDFMNGHVDKLSHAAALSMYLNLHNSEVLANSIYPSGAILEDTYAEMIGNVINAAI